MKKIFILIFITFFIFSNHFYCPAAEETANTISLDFKGMDVVDVLKLIAQRGNMNIAISKNVRGKVTMFLKDVDVYDAFEIILATNDLAYERSGTILNVMTDKDYENLYGKKFNDKSVIETFELKYASASEISKAITQLKSKLGKVIVDEAANAVLVIDSPDVIDRVREIVRTLDKPIETRVFSLNYAKADEVKTKIEEKLTKNVGIVQVDERTNKIIVTELSSKLPEIEKLVNELDERTRVVLIEAKILEITLNDEYKWGVNWDRVFKIASNVASITAGVNFADAIAGTILPAESGSIIGSSLEIGGLSDHKYHALIEILKTIGKTEVLSSPRIVVINNEEASILVGTNQPYATTGTTVSETISQTTQQVTYVDLGVKLHVTPTINKDGYITMKIKPEVSSKTSDYTITSEEGTTIRTTTVPVISTSEAETTVMLKDGNTIVLAGLIERRKETREDKVPFMSDIPLIGNMFKSKTRGSSDYPERRELVIFLTPHIISGDAMSPEVKEYLTTAEVGKSEIVQPPEKKKVRTRFKWQAREEDLPQADFNEEETESKKTEAEGPSEPAYSPAITRGSYYNVVRDKVLRFVRLNYPRSGITGDVYISFRIASDGMLVGEPKVLAPTDETLKMLAVKSVKEASPFPQFPQSITDSVETFKIVISYK